MASKFASNGIFTRRGGLSGITYLNYAFYDSTLQPPACPVGCWIYNESRGNIQVPDGGLWSAFGYDLNTQNYCVYPLCGGGVTILDNSNGTGSAVCYRLK